MEALPSTTGRASHGPDTPPHVWQRWVRQPQTLWIRKALFQVHLWSGLAFGFYMLMISVTGSVLVYRNQLYQIATPAPLVVQASGPRLTDEQLKEAAVRAYAGYRVASVTRPRNPDQAVDVWLRRDDDVKKRLFDPYTGGDLGNSVPTGIWLISKSIDLHDNLLGGPTGRKVNGIGASALLLLTLTGAVIWWPGIKAWRRHLHLRRGVTFKRFVWEVHTVIGFWSLGFILLFAVTGLYLSNQEYFQDLADAFEPMTDQNAGKRAVDAVTYWLAYLHFGRLGGRGIPWCGRGWCNSMTMAIWATFGLIPALMIVTGVAMWWTRVVRRPRANRQ